MVERVDAGDHATDVFVAHRELLFSVVYNMLGSVADTEDVLQETWLSWSTRVRARDARPIDNPRGYLVRIAVNQAFARRAEIDRRRETYVGQWLPEPLVTPLTDTTDASAPALRTDSISMALLVVLESLTALERTVFVLHEVFGYAHTEIATILDRNPAAIRQLAHRAREHVRARRPLHQPDPRTRRAVTEKFLSAALGGDLQALLEVLAPDVTLWTDGGGKGPATSLHPIHGREAVARTLHAVATHAHGFDIAYRRVNGDPSAILFDSGSPIAVLVLDLTPDNQRVRGVYSVTNPDKLTRINVPAQEA
ncbi:RNA polymerase sigma factor SigJ [Saccharothrix variisporea]|uniref:RNA polymerase sigma-70 factor (ECF subfamily) n=1 Tax=Saccharothrix variisporea TaxID=543527 RepID=A0A495X977_9PSEU|nr:RNA polymerase sigma factor SigJ [Saccharothrix variisporea]RKT69163.1 RNA polymerase sigma-70 factor (ECF subfamily) [Saccharothrix variisporea]